MSDPRFARLKSDPRFRRPKTKNNKVVIDERFKSVFKSDKKKNGMSSFFFGCVQYFWQTDIWLMAILQRVVKSTSMADLYLAPKIRMI